MNSNGFADVGYFLSRDSRPHCGKASPIQKGLILSREGISADLCEEGVGFGVPLLKYRRDFYFPGTASCSCHGEIISPSEWKKFELNLIDRHQKGTSPGPEVFSWIYQRLYNRVYKSHLGRKVIELGSEVGNRLGVNFEGYTPEFFRVKSKGQVVVNYEFLEERRRVKISIDISKIDRTGLQEVYISNELGGILFNKYNDDTGISLVGDEISGWDRIKGRNPRFMSEDAGLFFEVEIPPHVQAYRGREVIGDIISWSGVILSLPPSTQRLEYFVRFGKNSHTGKVRA